MAAAVAEQNCAAAPVAAQNCAAAPVAAAAPWRAPPVAAQMPFRPPPAPALQGPRAPWRAGRPLGRDPHPLATTLTARSGCSPTGRHTRRNRTGCPTRAAGCRYRRRWLDPVGDVPGGVARGGRPSQRSAPLLEPSPGGKSLPSIFKRIFLHPPPAPSPKARSAPGGAAEGGAKRIQKKSLEHACKALSPRGGF